MEDWSSMCRGCLAMEAPNSLMQSEDIREKFFEATTIDVKEEDGLPHGLCEDCLSVINMAFQFKKQCLRIEKELKTQLEEVLLHSAMQSTEDAEIPGDQEANQDTMMLPPNVMIKSEQLESDDDCYYVLVIDDEKSSSENKITEELKKDTVEPSEIKKELEFEKSVDSFLVRQEKPKQSVENLIISSDQMDQYDFTEDQETNGSENHSDFILPDRFHLSNTGILNEDGNIIKILTDGGKADNLLFKGENGDEIVTYIVNDNQLVSGTDGLPQEVIVCEDDDSQYQILNCDGSEFVIGYSDSGQVTSTVMIQKDGTFVCPCGAEFANFVDYENHAATHAMSEEQHACTLCGKVFESNEILTGHMLLHTNTSPNIDCPYCFQSVKRNTLTQHIKYAHNEPKPQCNVCHKKFANPNNLKRHLTIHTGVKPFKCDVCSKSFHQKITLQSHKATHHFAKPISCNFCQKLFQSTNDLIDHQKQQCTFGDPDENDLLAYNCQLCETVETSKSDLQAHIQSFHAEKPLELLCSECGDILPSLRAMSQHTLQFHSEPSQSKSRDRRFDCATCGKICTSQALLIMHERVHTNERPYQCPLCNFRFKTKTHLRTHQLTHTREKRFGCSVCMKFFALKGNLVVHLRTHTGERPYICLICKEAFIDSKYLKKHKEKKHNINKAKPSNEY